jgi:hypothetical protein
MFHHTLESEGYDSRSVNLTEVRTKLSDEIFCSCSDIFEKNFKMIHRSISRTSHTDKTSHYCHSIKTNNNDPGSRDYNDTTT